MNESAAIEPGKNDLAGKDGRAWLPWVVGLLFLIGAGVAAWSASAPDLAERLIAIDVADPNSLSQGRAGDQNRIPIRITNRSDRPIRLVGNNAC